MEVKKSDLVQQLLVALEVQKFLEDPLVLLDRLALAYLSLLSVLEVLVLLESPVHLWVLAALAQFAAVKICCLRMINSHIS